MQRIFLILPLLLLFTISSFGQKKQVQTDAIIALESSKKTFLKSFQVDTAYVEHSTYGSDCDSIGAFPTETGYVFGPNNFGDKEKGVHLEFENPGKVNVIGAAAYFYTEDVSGDGNIYAVVYAVSENGVPGEELGRSLPLKTSAVVTLEDGFVAPTFFEFEENISLGGTEVIFTIDFSALYETGDQLSLFATYGTCGTPGDAWEKWSDDQWLTIDQAWEAPALHIPFMGLILETNNDIACEVSGGVLEGGPFTFCVGDDEVDMIGSEAIKLSNNSGENSQWLVTDADGTILGLPSTLSEVNFNDAPTGTCLLWHLSSDGEITGASVEANANNIEGCYNLSNAIEVLRLSGEDCPESELGTAQTAVKLVAEKDATIFSEDSNGSNGAGDLFIGRTNQPANRRALVQFDLSSIPSNASIVSASLTLTGSKQSTSSINAHRMTADWGEGTTMGMGNGGGIPSPAQTDDATWSHGFYNTTSWSSSGGDYDSQVIANAGISNNNIGLWSGDALAADVQKWVSGTAENFGWILIGDEGTMGSAVRVVSKEASSSESPMLEITYTTEAVMECEVTGGTLEGGPFSFCVGDGIEDKIPADAITLTGNEGANSQWVVTYPDGSIAGLSPSFADVNFDGAGTGICSVWHLSYEDGIQGFEQGALLADIIGCYNLSNPIEVNRTQPEGGVLEGGPFAFTVSDGEADMIDEGAITVSGANGANTAWVVTDDQNNILGLPGNFADVNFDGAGTGTCLVWYLSYEDGLEGLQMGENTDNLVGCFDLSNAIKVVRTEAATCDADGGVLEGGPFTFCVGNDEDDMIGENEITLSGNVGANSQWVVTDNDGNILGLPASFSDVNFDGADAGTCQIWFLSHEGEFVGATVGSNTSDFFGCYSLSNPVTVNRINEEDCPGSCGAIGGTLEGGPFTFCAGDEEADMISEDQITLSDNQGENSQWVITDSNGTILGLPTSFTGVNFDGAGAGTCLVWHLSYDGVIAGATVDANATDIEGCFSLSNPITVNRVTDEDCPDYCPVEGGTLEGGPFTFCVGNDEDDMIGENEITLSGNVGANSQWVVTDNDGNILGLPASFSDVNFDGADAGTCQIWFLSHEGEFVGATVGSNTSDFFGCYSLSNPVTVNRINEEDCPGSCGAIGGTLEGGPFTFCAGDEEADMISEDQITLSDNQGENSQWVITDSNGTILGLPTSFTGVNFDGAGAGTCLVWHLSYDGVIAGATVDANATDIEGCFSLSNPITVNRVTDEDCPDYCPVEGGTLEGGPFTFCVGNDEDDMIRENEITLSGNVGANSQWVVTDNDGNILGLPASFSDVNFDGADAGTCQIWFLSHEGEFVGATVGSNTSDFFGCYSLSNPVTVNRINEEDCPGSCGAIGGTLEGGPFTFCVGDEEADMISEDQITLSDNQGENSQWVITDSNGTILGLPTSFTGVNFDGAGAGTCLVWHLSYDGEIAGATVDANATDIEGCFSLSNPITVNRVTDEDCPDYCPVEGGTLEGGPFTFCVGNDEDDMIRENEITLSGNVGANSQWVVTDNDGNILGLPASFSDVNFDGADAGTCLVWHLSYDGVIAGATVDANATDIEGCFSLSNPITVNRLDCNNVCHAPLNLRLIDSGHDRVTVRWSKVTQAIGYEILIGYEGYPNSFVNIPVRKNKVKVSYHYERTLQISVRTICRDGSTSDYTAVSSYTPQFRSEAVTRSTKSTETVYGEFSVIEDQVTFSPSPARNYVNISYEQGDQVEQISVWDVQGRQVMKTISDPQLSSQKIDVSELNGGIFILMITSDGELLHSERFVKVE